MSDWGLYDRGLSLFPLTPRTKSPALAWETYQTQHATPELVATWRQHHWNTGVATGVVSGCIVLDADSVMARLEAETRGLPLTLTVTTPRGTHWYFRHPGWQVINRAGRTWTKANDDDPGVDGWDLRGDGGYVVGPGSHYVPTEAEQAKGKIEGHYRIETDAPIADAPDWLLALTVPRTHKPSGPAKTADITSAYGRAALHDEVRKLIDAPDGTVNDTINLAGFAVGQLVAGGEIEANEGWGQLWEALAAKGILDDGKSPETLERGYTAGMLVPRGVEHGEPITPEQALGTRQRIAPPPPGSVEPLTTETIEARGLVRGQTIWHDKMDALFADCFYVERQEAIYVRGRGIVKKTTFDTIFGGFEFPTKVNAQATTGSAWEAFRTSPSWCCPIVYDICFRPDKEPGEVIVNEGRPYLNSWEPIKTRRIAGDASRFIDLIARMFPKGDDATILSSYICALVQNPGRKFQWWPVLQGIKGNGKTLILMALEYAVGRRYTHMVNPEAMGKTGNQFNSWIQGNLLIGVEEIFVSDQRHILESFKPLVTNVRTVIEGKGRDQTIGDNYANGMMLTNHKDGVPIADDERRYAIFWSAQQDLSDMVRDGMHGGYFPDIWDWLYGRKAYADLGEDYGFAVVNNWMHETVPAERYNPAGDCQRAPLTSSTAAAIRESLGALEQEVLEAIEEERTGFRGRFVASHALRSLFAGMRVNVGPKRYRSIMNAIGYVPHPALLDGRVTSPLKDGTRPRLYVDKNSDEAKLSANDAVANFEISQSGSVINSGNVVPIRR